MNELVRDSNENPESILHHSHGFADPSSPDPSDYPVQRMMRYVQQLSSEDDAPLTEPAVLAPFWGPGDMVIFSGEPGCGKTFIAADIIIAAMAPEREGSALGGLLLFDQERFGNGRLAILDAENDDRRWSSILRNKMDREGIAGSWLKERIRYVPTGRLGLNEPEHREEQSQALARLLRQLGVRFYIGDTVARIWSPENINSTDWVQKGLAPFRTACREYGITGLILSHTRRRGSDGGGMPTGPLGSSMQEAQADGQVMLVRTHHGDQDGLELIHRKSRRSHWIRQGSKVIVRFTADYGYEPLGDFNNRWSLEPPDPSDETGPESTSNRVLGCLRDVSPRSLKRSEIETQLGIAESTARLHLSRLHQQKKVQRLRGGKNTEWQYRGGDDR